MEEGLSDIPARRAGSYSHQPGADGLYIDDYFTSLLRSSLETASMVVEYYRLQVEKKLLIGLKRASRRPAVA